ncbi:MAG: hypothetical protein IMF06_02910 [Proteobacteria bacterium]|nr:hypothetical protein [Pseudomonadota bacterium]
MFIARPFLASAVFFSALLLLQACSDDQKSTARAAPVEEPTVADAESGGLTAPTENILQAGDSSADTAVTAKDAEEIDPESLEPAGEVELRQYSVAWVGSGTLGGGTLTIDGESYPFSIVGLGLGGFGASVVEAKGVVYNLPSRDAFPGTYGNARLGMTAGESGGGKLWLRNPDGVVIELESEMRGLALAGGVDGLIIQWDEDEKSSVDDAMDGTEEVVGKGIEVGADAVEKGIGKVKGWMKMDGD